MRKVATLFFALFLAALGLKAEAEQAENFAPLKNKSVVFIARTQYPRDHHNSATIFQKGEINQNAFRAMQRLGSAIFKVDFDASGKASSPVKLLDCPKGVVRDLQVSFDAKKLLFSMREDFDDCYKICELDLNTGKVSKLTQPENASDIDPIYLPNGDILFVSTRDVKFCACNRHIMGNLFRTKRGQVTQIGKSKEFENNPALLADGRIIYTRWEYTDKNFGGSQGLWVANPDGTRHAIYCWQETPNPIVDACPLPNGKVAGIICTTHGRPHGALAIFDVSKSIEGAEIVEFILPENSRQEIGKNFDSFEHGTMGKDTPKFEDPSVLDKNHLLVSRQVKGSDDKTALFAVNIKDAKLTKILELDEQRGIYDAHVLRAQRKVSMLPELRTYKGEKTIAHIANVYEGTHLEGVKRGDVKFVRVVENPPKYYWSDGAWEGQGQQAPAMNYDDFDPKVELGIAPVNEDGSASFEIPTRRFIYLQLLDKDKNMIQTMRSGLTAMPGEIISCIGCHESRVNAVKTPPRPTLKAPSKLVKTLPDESFFSYIKLIQPIFDKNCLGCHDYGKEGAKKLILAGDRGLVFNKSYTQLHSKKYLKVVNAGPDKILNANYWGAKHSPLIKILEAGHNNAKLSAMEMETLRLWIDLNAPYYGADSAFYGKNPGGRSPLNFAQIKEIDEILKLKNKNFFTGMIINARRYPDEIISFDRPEKSELLELFEEGSKERARLLELVKIGAENLKKNPREDMEGFELVGRDLENKKRAEAFRLQEEKSDEKIGSLGRF